MIICVCAKLDEMYDKEAGEKGRIRHSWGFLVSWLASWLMVLNDFDRRRENKKRTDRLPSNSQKCHENALKCKKR